MEYAKVIEKWGAKTPNGREKKWVLRMGKTGRGEELITVAYWPWSGPSIEAAERTIRDSAKRAGVAIIW